MSMASKTMVTNKHQKDLSPPSLPTEILVDIFAHVAHVDPFRLCAIERVSRHWRAVVASFEDELWATALAAVEPFSPCITRAFGRLFQPDPVSDDEEEDISIGTENNHIQGSTTRTLTDSLSLEELDEQLQNSIGKGPKMDWRRAFRICDDWMRHSGQLLVINPQLKASPPISRSAPLSSQEPHQEQPDNSRSDLSPAISAVQESASNRSSKEKQVHSSEEDEVATINIRIQGISLKGPDETHLSATAMTVGGGSEGQEGDNGSIVGHNNLLQATESRHPMRMSPAQLCQDDSSVVTTTALIHPTEAPTTAVSSTPEPTKLDTPKKKGPGHELTLTCNFDSYEKLCPIPQARICVQTSRNADQPLMRVMDWSFKYSVNVNHKPKTEDEEEEEVDLALTKQHQDLISCLAVNDQGTLLATSSIDSTVRVWRVHPDFLPGAGEPPLSELGTEERQERFKKTTLRVGCPLIQRHVLIGHEGWVNAVAIQDTVVASGGSDYSVRVWDAVTGSLISVIPDLFRHYGLNLGVFSVTLDREYCLVGAGSILLGYKVHNWNSGQLVYDLDEPITIRDHYRFDEEGDSQEYACEIHMVDSVIITTSKLRGWLCVWSRASGQLLYRIDVKPDTKANPMVINVGRQGRHQYWSRPMDVTTEYPQRNTGAPDVFDIMSSIGLTPASVAAPILRSIPLGAIFVPPDEEEEEDDDDDDDDDDEGEEGGVEGEAGNDNGEEGNGGTGEEVYGEDWPFPSKPMVTSFSASRDGSMLMCVLSTGQVSFIEMGQGQGVQRKIQQGHHRGQYPSSSLAYPTLTEMMGREGADQGQWTIQCSGYGPMKGLERHQPWVIPKSGRSQGFPPQSQHSSVAWVWTCTREEDGTTNHLATFV